MFVLCYFLQLFLMIIIIIIIIIIHHHNTTRNSMHTENVYLRNRNRVECR